MQRHGTNRYMCYRVLCSRAHLTTPTNVLWFVFILPVLIYWNWTLIIWPWFDIWNRGLQCTICSHRPQTIHEHDYEIHRLPSAPVWTVNDQWQLSVSLTRNMERQVAHRLYGTKNNSEKHWKMSLANDIVGGTLGKNTIIRYFDLAKVKFQQEYRELLIQFTQLCRRMTLGNLFCLLLSTIRRRFVPLYVTRDITKMYFWYCMYPFCAEWYNKVKWRTICRSLTIFFQHCWHLCKIIACNIIRSCDSCILWR